MNAMDFIFVALDKCDPKEKKRLGHVYEGMVQVVEALERLAFESKQKPKRTGEVLHRWKYTDDDGGWRFTAIVNVSIIEAIAVDQEALSLEDAAMDYVCETLDVSLYRDYNGPGRPFRHAPVVYQRGSRMVVTQSGGYDI